jgi:acyl carrier protein
MSMHDATELKQKIKALMVENLMLQVTAAEIGNDQLLFGPGSLGLDSVDALQLVVALDKHFGLKIPDPAAAKEILQSVNTIAEAVLKKQAGV